MKNEQLQLWVAILITCDGVGNDLSDESEDARVCAAQMSERGLLERLGPDTYALSSDGHRTLMLLIALMNLSLGID